MSDKAKSAFEAYKKRKQEEEEKDESEKKQSSTTSSVSKAESAFEAYQKRQYGKLTVDQDYINSFISDANSFLSSAKDDYDSVGWKNASSVYDTKNSALEGLKSRANYIGIWLDSNKSKLDSETYKSLSDALSSFKNDGSSVLDSFKSAKDYYSQWKTEDDYKAYESYKKDYDAKSSLDLDAAQAEIEDLEKRLDTAEKIQDQIDIINTRADQTYAILRNQGYTDSQAKAKAEEGRAYADAEIAKLKEQYGDVDALKSLITEKQTYLNQAKHIQEGISLASVTESEDFGEYSEIGLAMDGEIKWYGADVGENKIVAYRGGVGDLLSAQAMRGGGGDGAEITFARAMTEDEVAIYSYYIAKGEKQKAEDYLYSIEETVNARVASGVYEMVEDNVFLELAFGVGAGLDQFKSGIEALFSDKDYINQSSTQMASGMIREDLADSGFKLPEWLGGASFGQVTYDTVTTTANMLPSILISQIPVVGQWAGAVTLGASASGNAYAEMLNLGYSKEQARTYSALVGGAETGLQYLLGGISSLGGTVKGGVTGLILKHVDNAFARVAIQIGGSMLSEGFEEGLQTALEPWFKHITTGVDFEAAGIDEVLYSSLLGALSAGVLESVGTIVREVSTYNKGKTVQKTDGAFDRLVSLGTTFSADTVAGDLARRVNEKTGAYTVGRLLNEVGASLSEKNMSDIESALVGEGMSESDAKTISKWLNNAVNGSKLTKSQAAALENNDVISKVFRDVIIDQNSTVNQRNIEYQELYDLATQKSGAKTTDAQPDEETTPLSSEPTTMFSNEEIARRIAKTSGIPSSTVSKMHESASGTPSASKSVAENKPSAEGNFKASENGKTINTTTGEEVDIEEIASVKDGVVMLRLGDGNVVNASEISFGTTEKGLLYENVVDMGLNAATANAFVNGYDGSMTVQEYALGFREAYRYGEYGFPVQEMSTKGFSARLSQSQKDLAYGLGKTDAKYKVAEKQTAVSQKEKGETKKGKVHYEGSKELTDLQKASLDGLEVVADALGIEFHIFESEVVDGKRQGANGWFDPNDGSIHIDLFAGLKGKGTILFTAAHELTHFIREWSPAKFKIFADFLLEQYGKKGVSVDDLVKAQIQKAKNNGRDISYDTAYEEVVADSCEAMLADGNAISKIAELKAKDKSLWQKIKDFINSFVAKIKKVYDGLKPDSTEGRFVKDMLDVAEQLKTMWTEALVDAGEAFSSLVEIDADSESVSPMFSERTWTASEYVTERKETAKKISKALGVSLKIAYKYIDDINGVARLVADDRARLDYEPNLDNKATVLKPNSEYKYSVDMSTLCAKRLLFTGTFDAIQKALPDMVFDSDDIVSLREMMQQRGYEVACGICYVESTRREIGRITQEFIDRYKVAQKTGNPISRINSSGKEVVLKSAGRTFSADKNYTPNLGELNTTDIDLVKRDHPEVYDAYLAFMNARGQAKPKLLETRAEYKGEILKHFKAKSAVEARNKEGGLRLQSFSDFEVPHMIDMMQIVMDMSRVGLKSQAYTKVPAFAEVFGDSGVKINLSLIAKGEGLDSNGNLIFDDVEGINHKEAFRLRDKYSKNVGTILVGKNDAHIIAAMADPRIDYIIPFHKSYWKESLYDALGLTGYADYTDTQNEKSIDKSRKISNFDPSEYWDFTKSGDENAQIYLEKCREDERIPKFPQFQGYPGYWKLLIDFKMYDNDGVGSPQEVVKPVFNTEESEKILREYEGGHRSFPVAKDVVTDFVKQHKDVKLSDRDTEGNTLSDGQKAFFANSKARDADGNLLVLYHGTGNAGFTTFDTSRGRYGGTWFTTSKRDADSYAGNYKGKLFDPNETDDIRSSVGGNYTLNSWMRFDTEEDRANFLKQNPNADKVKTDAYYDELLAKTEDFDEYDRLETEQFQNRKELKKLQKAYDRYEWEHSREATLRELFDHPERFSVTDVLRAWDAIDRNNAARDEEYTKEDLIEGLREEHNRLIEDGEEGLGDFTFKARIPVGESGEIVNRANNRTYAVYANLTHPYEINANQRTLHGANLYPTIERAMKDSSYDGVIVRNAQVGAYEDTGDVVIIKSSEQVKLISNKTPSEGSDIRYSDRDYSYEALTSKPDMLITTLSGIVPNNRADIVAEAKKNAAKFGKGNPKDGSVSVHVNDIGADVLLGTDGLKHGLRRTKDLQNDANAIVTLNAGEILRRSICINELKPSKTDASNSYVLIGTARHENGDLYIVRSVVNRFELASMDVLYAINAKKESAALNAPRFTAKPLSVTDSIVSIAQLLDFVNRHFPDILPEPVWRHYGYTERPKGNLGESALYSDRDPDLIAQKSKIDKVLEIENTKLKEDNQYLKELVKLQRKVTHGTKFTKSSVETVAGRLMTYANAKGNKAELTTLLHDFYGFIAESKDLSWEGIAEKAQPVIDWLMYHESKTTKLDANVRTTLNTIREKRIYLDDAQQAEVAHVYGSFYEYRKRAMGSLTIVNKGNPKGSISLDSQWQEFAELYPEYFDADTNPNDMPVKLMEIVDTLRNSNSSTMEYEYSDEMAEQDLLSKVYDSYWEVSTLHTVADSMQKEINLLKIKHRQKMTEVREYHTEKHSQLKKEYQDKINRIRQEDREKAAKTQRELMTRYQESRKKAVEGRHKTEMRHKIKGVVSDLNQLLLHGSKERNVKLGLQEAVASALEAVNMDTVAAEERIAKLEQDLMKAKTPEKIQEISRKIDNIRNQGDAMASRLEALRRAYAEIKASDENIPEHYKSEASLIADRVDSVMTKVGNTPLRNMSLSQLEAVYDLYKMVLTTVRNANAVFKQGKMDDLHRNVSEIMMEVTSLPKLKEERLKVGGVANSFSWNEMIPVYAFERIGSKTLTSFFWETVKGQNTFAQDINEAKEFSSSARKQYGYSKWDMSKVHEFKLADGRTFRVTLKHMMSIYAYSKREQALEHMRKGGFFFNDKETFRKKGGILEVIKSNEEGYYVDDAVLAQIKSTMTQEQIQYVDAMQEYLTKMGEKGNEVSRVLWGIDIFKEKVYFPLKSSKDFIFQANQTAQEASLKNDGMTKATVPGASNPIVLEAFDDVWANHVNRMSQYHAFVLPIENLNKIHNYGSWAGTASMSVSTMLSARYGAAVNDYLTNFIKDLNGASSMHGASNPFISMMSKFKKTAVAASMSVVVQQPTAVLRAMAVMDAKYYIGMPKLQKLSTKWSELKQYAPIAIVKEIGGFDAGAGRQATAWLNDNTRRGIDKVMGKIDDATMFGAALGDQLGWCTIWEAVKREIKATTNLKEGSEEFLKKAGERFTEVVVLTQVYDSTLSRSGYMRSKHDSVKMLTAFMGEPTVSINMMFNAVVQAKRKKITKRTAARIIGSVYASIVAASVASSLIYALRDDDEDESYLEKFAEALGGKLLSDMNPINMLPAFRDIVSILDGWDVERTDVAIFKDIKDAFDGLGSDSKSTWRKIEDFSGAIASLFGLPLKNVLRTGREIYNGIRSIFDDVKPSGVGESFVRGITGEKKNKGKALYDAIIHDDEARLKLYKENYKDDKSYESAVRSALRENDPRIKEAAQARLDGDIAKYTRIAREIIGEGYFKQDTVVAAINAEINALKKRESTTESSSSNKVESIYEIDDYYVALVGRDQATAYTVKEDIIKTEIANGKDREEAEANFNARFASHVREQYEEGYISAYEAENMLVQYGEKSEEDAASKVQYWAFTQKYPDYDLTESAVTKYYEEVEPSGITVDVYYDYSKERAKCKGTDSDGDGKTDSGSVKSEVMLVIDSLPITYEQKDVLYYLNGWSANTIYEAPWH